MSARARRLLAVVTAGALWLLASPPAVAATSGPPVAQPRRWLLYAVYLGALLLGVVTVAWAALGGRRAQADDSGREEP